MRLLPILAAAAVLALVQGRLHAAPDTATRTVVAHAQVASRTSLRVSSPVLEFSVPKNGETAVATVDFVAGVRTPAGAEIVLTVEAHLAGTIGESRITFAGAGDGTRAGSMVATGPAIAARWIGSGRRTGRIAFALQGAAPGTYAIPVRFVLSAP